MRTRFFQLRAVLALVLCFSAGWAQPTSVATAQNKGSDTAFLTKAEAGGAEVQYKLGNLYHSDDGVRRDYSQAEFWFRKVAEQGHHDSQFMLGGLYHFGNGVPQDSVQAFDWVKNTAMRNAITTHNLFCGRPKDLYGSVSYMGVTIHGLSSRDDSLRNLVFARFDVFDSCSTGCLARCTEASPCI
jgi:TPR repeat protein